jgi:hypothetical protein
VTGFLEFVGDLFATIGMVLGMDSSQAAWFESLPDKSAIAITIAVLAGVSTLIGNSVVLFINRVRGWRFAVTLLLNGVAMVLLYIVQALVIVLVAPPIVGSDGPGTWIVVRSVMLSSAPLVFGFLVLIPYLGPAIGRVLQAWSVVALWAVVAVVFVTDVGHALVVTLIGWGVMQLASWGLSRPMKWIGDRIWQLVSGRPSMLSGTDLLSGDFFIPLDGGFVAKEARR